MTATVSVRVPDEVKEQLEAAAQAQNQTSSDFVKELIRRELAGEPAKPGAKDHLATEKKLLDEFMKYERLYQELAKLENSSHYIQQAQILCQGVLMQHTWQAIEIRLSRIRMCSHCGDVLVDGDGKRTDSAKVHKVKVGDDDEGECQIKIDSGE